MKAPKDDKPDKKQQLAWFVGLYLVGLLAVLAFAYLLRGVLYLV